MIPNFVGKPKTSKRKYIGEEINDCDDYRSILINRPHDRGYLLNWNLQSQIWSLNSYWNRKYGIAFEGGDVDLILTEPLFNPESLRSSQNEFIFEMFKFRSLLCCSAPYLSQRTHKISIDDGSEMKRVSCSVIVDCGYSFTHIVPFYDNMRVNYAVKRINVGGKLLTNYLKEIISYRYFNMMEETYITNIIKERLCFVSNDFKQDLEISRRKRSENTIRKGYVLPDLTTSTLGYVLDDDNEKNENAQILYMNNERFTVPEVLFNPSLIGIDQCGIPEAIFASISEVPEELRELMYSNIILVGGSAKFPGFKDRIYQELRKLVPQDYKINIHLADDPINSAWAGGVDLSNDPNLKNMVVTKQDYDEFGEPYANIDFRYYNSNQSEIFINRGNELGSPSARSTKLFMPIFSKYSLP